MTMQTKPRLIGAAALALALVAGAGAAPRALAQVLPAPGDGFTWERVGDIPVNARDLAFDSDGVLWAPGAFDLWRLDLSTGFPGTWVVANDGFTPDALFPLGPDTLVAATGASTRRSLDGGATWAIVYEEGGRGLYEVPPGHPYAGRVLVGDSPGIAYSLDRAASFTAATVPDQGTGTAGGADDFAMFPPGTPYAGRLVAPGTWGVNLSDDGGQTFRKSARWQPLLYRGHEVELVEHAASPGGVRPVVIGADGSLPYYRAWVSDDGGETWADRGGFPEGPPVGPGAWPAALLSLGGGSALVVLARGTVYRTADAGERWEPIGRAPDVSEDTHATAAVLDSEGRLYVGLIQGGSNPQGWVYRTAEVVVAAEPGPVPEEGLGLSVQPNPSRGATTVTLTLSRPSEASASVYDGLGRRVAVLHEGALAAGTHALRFDASVLPAGAYAVRAVAGAAVVTRQLTLVR